MRRISQLVVLATVAFLIVSTPSFGARRIGEAIEVTSIERLSGTRTPLRIGDDVRLVSVGRIPLAQAYETVEAQMRLMEAAALVVAEGNMALVEKSLNEIGEGFALEMGTKGILLESFGPHELGSYDFVYVKVRLIEGSCAGKELWFNKKNVAKTDR